MADGLSHDFGRSRSESLSTAPVGAKKAMFSDLGKEPDKPALVKCGTKGTVSAVGANRCMTTRADPKRGKKFNKNDDGLPPQKSLASLP